MRLIQLDEVLEAQFIREHLEVAAFSAACARPSRDASLLTEILRQQRLHYKKAADFGAFFAAPTKAFHAQIFALNGHPGAWDAVQRSKIQLDRMRHLARESLAQSRRADPGNTAGIARAYERGGADAERQEPGDNARAARCLTPMRRCCGAGTRNISSDRAATGGTRLMAAGWECERPWTQASGCSCVHGAVYNNLSTDDLDYTGRGRVDARNVCLPVWKP